jgi:hypothetical protein
MAVSIIHSESQKTLAGKVVSGYQQTSFGVRQKKCFSHSSRNIKMDIERAYMEHVGSPGIMDLEILSFSRFCLRVLDEGGCRTNRYIDETESLCLSIVLFLLLRISLPFSGIFVPIPVLCQRSYLLSEK